jgi:hypothetical protein
MLPGGVGNRDNATGGGAGQCVLRHGNRIYTVASASQCLYTGSAGQFTSDFTFAASRMIVRVFITNVKGTFLGMSESEEASKRR